MRASEPFEPSSICEQVRGSRLVFWALLGVVLFFGRRFGRRFVFGRFRASSCFLGVGLGVVSFWGAFGRRIVRRFKRRHESFLRSECECRGSATSFAMSRYSDGFSMERCSDQFRDDAIVAMEQRISRCRDGATNLAMSRWSDEFGDVAMERRFLR
jgi:hypothetical protein